MTAKEFYDKGNPYLWSSDDSQKNEGFYSKNDMIKFANQYTLSVVENAVRLVDKDMENKPNDSYKATYFIGLSDLSLKIKKIIS